MKKSVVLSAALLAAAAMLPLQAMAQSVGSVAAEAGGSTGSLFNTTQAAPSNNSGAIWSDAASAGAGGR